MTYSDELKREAVGVPGGGPGRARRGLGAGRAGDGERRSRADRGGPRGVGDRIAGPDGGSPSKPVGLTYVAVADALGREVRRHVWTGDRAENKRRSAAAALELLLERIEAQAAAATGRSTPPDARSGPDSSRSGRHGPSGTGERIHVVGAAGAGASAAALLAAHAGAIVTGCDPGGALAVHAGPRRARDRDRSGTFRCPRDGRSPARIAWPSPRR